jgi:flagellar basal-body rod modification protein FlgD
MSSAAIVASNPSSQAVAQTERKNTLTQQDFLKLFTTQMQYQDPMAPLYNFQMATQMAQFNTVEALNTMVSSIQNLESYQASVNSLQTVGLIGKTVEVGGNTLSVEPGKSAEGYYQLANPGKVSIQIFDANGNLVRVIDEGVKDTSKQKWTWDGKNQAGTSVPKGTYTFQVVAKNEKDQAVTATTSKVGTVTGVSFESGVTYLMMGNDRVTLSDIVSIRSEG